MFEQPKEGKYVQRKGRKKEQRKEERDKKKLSSKNGFSQPLGWNVGNVPSNMSAQEKTERNNI